MNVIVNLYPYQQEGVDWLLKKPRAMLCDEQGLGKTIQAIVLADRVHADQVLVICPTVVLWNWAREFSVWSPERHVQILSKTDDRIDPFANVVITTHGLMITPFIRAQLLGQRWGLTVLDEAHFFRTPEAQRTQGFYGKHGKTTPTIVDQSNRVIALTGTPMPNDTSELWTHLWGLRPDLVTFKPSKHPVTWDKFRELFCMLRPGAFQIKVIGNKNLKTLLPIMGQVMLRRTTAEVLKDLPPIRYEMFSLRPVELPELVQELSEYLRPRILRDLQRTPRGRRRVLHNLRNDTQFAEFRRLCGLAKVKPIVELLQMELSVTDEKVIIFAHHTDVVKGIADGLQEFGVMTITGATSPKLRQKAVDYFQIDPTTRVIVANLVAGGVGVTLTAGCKVNLAEMSYVPGENAQAVKRAHRIGQLERVHVRCFSLAGTPDESIVDTLRLKTQMIREVLT